MPEDRSTSVHYAFGAYLLCILNSLPRALSLPLSLSLSLSWATLESSPSILDEGQKHNGNKAATLLSAVFHTHCLSSPPERFLQIGV